jgi:hypothetical protein
MSMNASDTGSLSAVGEHWIRLTEQEAQLNLRTVLELCAGGELRCGDKTHRPSAATVYTVSLHLTHGDFYRDEPIASFAWPRLVQAGGLAEIEGERLRLTAKGRTALRKPSAEVICQLWQRWLSYALIDEFSRIEQIKGQRARNVLSSAKTRHQMVAAALTNCPADEWVSMEALFATMRRGNMSPTIARNEMALWKLFSSMPTTAASATTAFTGGRSSKAGTPLRCCSNTPARWVCSTSTTSTPVARETTSKTTGAETIWTR